MKRASVLAVLLAVACSAAFAQVWFTGSFDEARAKAGAEQKLVLIDFYSDG